jgi:hypothetical protein
VIDQAAIERRFAGALHFRTSLAAYGRNRQAQSRTVPDELFVAMMRRGMSHASADTRWFE